MVRLTSATLWLTKFTFQRINVDKVSPQTRSLCSWILLLRKLKCQHGHRPKVIEGEYTCINKSLHYVFPPLDVSKFLLAGPLMTSNCSLLGWRLFHKPPYAGMLRCTPMTECVFCLWDKTSRTCDVSPVMSHPRTMSTLCRTTVEQSSLSPRKLKCWGKQTHDSK